MDSHDDKSQDKEHLRRTSASTVGSPSSAADGVFNPQRDGDEEDFYTRSARLYAPHLRTRTQNTNPRMEQLMATTSRHQGTEPFGSRGWNAVLQRPTPPSTSSAADGVFNPQRDGDEEEDFYSGSTRSYAPYLSSSTRTTNPPMEQLTATTSRHQDTEPFGVPRPHGGIRAWNALGPNSSQETGSEDGRHQERAEKTACTKKMVTCKFWIQGRCKYGDRCRFAHHYTPASLFFIKPRPCYHWMLTRRCPYGERCVFAHYYY